MKSKMFALMIAAALMAGSYGITYAGERDDDSSRPEWSERGPGRGPGRGDRFHENSRRGPGSRHYGSERGRHEGRGFHKDGFGPGMMDRLDLTADQKTKLVDVMTNSYRAKLEARMEMQEAKSKLRDLRDADDATSEAIIAANEEMGTAKGKFEVLMRQTKDDFEAVLTPEQKEKLESFRDTPRHRGPGKAGRGPGGPGRDAPRPRR